MRFRIEGANATTGVNQSVTITAPDEATAIAKAREHGVLPTSCKPIAEPPKAKTQKGEAAPSPFAALSQPESVPPTSKPSPKGQGISSLQGTIIIILLLVGLGAPCLGWLKPTPQWEYTIVSPTDIEFEQSMNSLGANGWELVFARRATSLGASDVKYELILKRPKQWYSVTQPSPAR